MKKFLKALTAVTAAAAAALLFSMTAFAVCEDHKMDGGVITDQPTCELIGIVTYTCQNEGCGYSYVEKMGNLGHRYENGLCLNCGETDGTYVPTEAPVQDDAQETPAEPEASASTVQAEWEPPFVSPIVTAPEAITLAAPTAPLTAAVPEAETTGPDLFLIGGMVLILFSAAAVFTMIRKPELAR